MKMKFIILVLFAFAFSSCNFLEFDETNNLKTEEDVYKYFSSTKQVLTNIYSYLPYDFGTIDGAMRDCASDDGEFAETSNPIQDFNTGNWSANNVIDDAWELYSGIRAANSFLEQLKDVDFSRFQYSTSYQNEVKQLETFAPQARVLRAHFFFELARRYGDIAMPLGVLDLEEDKTIGKTSFNEVIAFIVSECTECAALLPERYTDAAFGGEIGRVTKGYAMALKSKALLYAASPLHNPEMDVEKWKASAKAAHDIIASGLYALDPNGVANNSSSPEAVLVIRQNNSSTFELNNFPLRFTEGSRTNPATANFPTQNLVDAFETTNGYAVTLTESGFVSADPDFNPNNPYNNRDPRFARSILADGTPFKNEIIDLKEGGQDYYKSVTEGGTPTGYYLKKYIQEATSFTIGSESSFKHSWVVYRYAETLLTYAESMIYAFGDPAYKDAEYTISALEALNQVRVNVNMPPKSIAERDEFIAALRNEWRVEFAFEDHRFWDVRRWKIGDTTQKQIYGVKITETAGMKSYRLSLCERRQWNQRMNLFPIPQEKLFVNANLNPQNTGW